MSGVPRSLLTYLVQHQQGVGVGFCLLPKLAVDGPEIKSNRLNVLLVWEPGVLVQSQRDNPCAELGTWSPREQGRPGGDPANTIMRQK